MKKKIFILATILVITVLLEPRLYILSVATWEYYNTDVVCTGREPTPPVELGESFSLPVHEVKPFIVITDLGYMYPGEEYEVMQEEWRGMATLLWVGKNGAVFTVMYVSKDRSKGYSRDICRWFAPLGDYR